MTAERTGAEGIQRDLDDTRSEIGETLTQIEHRLSPGQVLDQALQYFGGPHRVRPGVGDLIRENPLPITVIGIGLAWLAFSNSSKRPPRHERRRVESGRESAQSPAGEAMPAARAEAGVP